MSTTSLRLFVLEASRQTKAVSDQTSFIGEELVDRKVGLAVEELCSRALLLGEDVTPSSGEDTVIAFHDVLGNLSKSGCIKYATRSWDKETERSPKPNVDAVDRKKAPGIATLTILLHLN